MFRSLIGAQQSILLLVVVVVAEVGLLQHSFSANPTFIPSLFVVEAVSVVTPTTASNVQRKLHKSGDNNKTTRSTTGNNNHQNYHWWTSPRQFLLRKRELRLDTLELATTSKLKKKLQAAVHKGKGILVFPSTFHHHHETTTNSAVVHQKRRNKKLITNNMATSTTTTTNKPTTAQDVLWYVPNLIGYLRVVMALTGFILMATVPDTYWAHATLLYIGSFVGDLFDGWAARKLNQCSIMGGLLDMITDRCATLGFLFILSGDYAPVDTAMGFPFYRLVRSKCFLKQQ